MEYRRSHCGSARQIQLVTTRLWIRSPASISGLKIWRCCELWYRVAAVAPIQPLGWEPAYATGAGLKSQRKRKEKKRREKKSKKKEREYR